MTRINCVNVEELTQPELGGEWKEIGRVFNLVRKRVQNGDTPRKIKIPKDWTLGTGHVLFHYNKLQYVANRMQSLASEMLKRGYNPNTEMMDSIISQAKLDIPSIWWQDYIPTQQAIAENIQRMIERGTR